MASGQRGAAQELGRAARTHSYRRPRPRPPPSRVAVATSLPPPSLLPGMCHARPGRDPGGLPRSGELGCGVWTCPSVSCGRGPQGGHRSGRLRKGSTIPREGPPRGAKAAEEGGQRQERAALAPGAASCSGCDGSCSAASLPPPRCLPAATALASGPAPNEKDNFFFYRQKQTNKQTKGKGAHCTLRREGEEPGPRDSCRDVPARAATEPAAPGSLSSRRSRGPGRVPHPLPGSRASPRNPLLKRESPGVSPKVTGGASPGGQGCSCLLSGLRDI